MERVDGTTEDRTGTELHGGADGPETGTVTDNRVVRRLGIRPHAPKRNVVVVLVYLLVVLALLGILASWLPAVL